MRWIRLRRRRSRLPLDAGQFLLSDQDRDQSTTCIRTKGRLFGTNEESIAISKVASVHISTGVFWAEIVIESTGGTDPITSHGHRKADAQRIRDLIETYQSQSR